MGINKTHLITVVLCLVCFSAGKFLTSPKVDIKEVEKIVYKERSTTKTDTNHTVDKKETIKPDGTRIIETSSSTQRTSDKKTDIDTAKDSSKSHVTESRPDWHITATYIPVMYGHSIQSYGLDIQRRIFSEMYLGVSVSTQKTIGVSIGIGF